MTIKPVRMRLSRKSGFNLDAASRAINGLPAAKVARPSIFGNPFKVSDMVVMHQAVLLPAGETPRQAAVRYFREWLEGKAIVGQFSDIVAPPTPIAIRDHLGGKNLACFCHLGQPCHADVLLEIANG